MRIRCPKCELEREINPDAIPSTAALATCPRCKTRFRFRGKASAETGANSDSSPEVNEIISEAEEGFAAPVNLDAPASEKRTTPEKSTEPDAFAKENTAEGVPESTPVFRPENPEAKPLRASRPGKAEPGDAEAETWLDVPWERPDRYGQIMGLYQTILRVLFSAPKFFAALPRCRGTIMRPLLFYVLLGLFQVVIKLLWFRSVDPSVTDPRVQELLSSTDMSLSMTLIVSPGILALQLFLYAALFFLMLRLVQPEVVTFPVVLRVVAYSAAPLVMCAVPVIGPLVAMVWFAASCFMGCRFALNLPWHKVALALVPLYLIGFAVTMQFVQHLLSQG